MEVFCGYILGEEERTFLQFPFHILRYSLRKVNIGEKKSYLMLRCVFFFKKTLYNFYKSILSRIPSFILPNGKTVIDFYGFFFPLSF